MYVGGLYRKSRNVSLRNTKHTDVTEDSLDGRKRSTEKGMHLRELENQNLSLSEADNKPPSLGWDDDSPQCLGAKLLLPNAVTQGPQPEQLPCELTQTKHRSLLKCQNCHPLQKCHPELLT